MRRTAPRRDVAEMIVRTSRLALCADAGTEAASPPASAPAASASPGADWPETQSPGPLLSHEQLRRLHFDAERLLIEQALAHHFIRVGPQRGATRPEMIRSSEITGGFELRATCRARAPFDRNRVVGAPRHHSSERGKIRLYSPYASLETYAPGRVEPSHHSRRTQS